ncbi:jg27675 [Pararge aegeria aegeria]|uniref:Jg27675 protein n=1 Tax=Pararge aegeria aegeria TaxID=348720 RepID=A0A8S4QYQ8_9NEOP|nr:jg27675 [Pararge aegeria aegeria]
MYCKEPAIKKQKFDAENDTQYIETFTQDEYNMATSDTEITRSLPQKNKSPILENRQRSYKKYLEQRSNTLLKKLSRFPRTVLDENVIESKFFNEPKDLGNKFENSVTIEESPEKCVNTVEGDRKSNLDCELIIETQCTDIDSQKENCLSPKVAQISQILESSPKTRNPFKLTPSQCSENDPEGSHKEKSPKTLQTSPILLSSPINKNPFKLKPSCSENDSVLEDSQAFNSLSQKSPILVRSNTFKFKEAQLSSDTGFSESVIDNTFPYEDLVVPVDPEVTKVYI